MLPWSFFIPTSFSGIWRERHDPKGKIRLYLLIWAVFIFLFFSISDSQLVTYILPIFPPSLPCSWEAAMRAPPSSFPGR